MATAPAAPPERSKAMWIAVPIAIVAVVVVAFLVLAGLPFGGRDDRPKPAPRVEPETIAEGESQRHTTAIVDSPEIQPSQPVPTTTTAAAPPMTTVTPGTATAAPPPTTVARPPATRTVVSSRPIPATSTRPSVRVPAESSRPPEVRRELSESDAMGRLRGYITSRDDYGVSGECLQIESHGYSNRGYNLEALDTCDRRPLGRWRVDTVTNEVFRQRGDGRYLRP